MAVWLFWGLAAAPVQATEVHSGTPLVHPSLEKALLTAAPDAFLPIIIEWPHEPSLLAQFAGTGSKLQQRQQVIRALQAEAQSQTAALMAFLQTEAGLGQARNIRPYWISPVIALEAQPALIESLRTRGDIVQLRLDEPMMLPPFTPKEQSAAHPLVPGELLWNLAAINLQLAEQALGLDGTGVVVANLDTGVDWQHPALMTRYRGYRPGGLSIHYGNWHVSTNETYTYPGDGNGHGTHTMGTMVGDDGQGTRVGVAPGAQWIAVKIFTNNGVTYESWVHDAFEWIIAPEGDPSLAPDVVSNSWGSVLTSDPRYRPDVQALLIAGILPIFSAGNNGPGPGTVGIPGAYPESFAVGAVDDLLVPAYFSSRGPSAWNEFKPEVAAPGVDILSTFPGGGYVYGDGTSMAAPHVAGVAALLLQANPSLSPLDLDGLLRFTAFPLGAPIPNHQTGWGLVDAYLAALQVSGHGLLQGQVNGSGGGGIQYPTIAASPIGGGSPATIQGNQTGAFSVYLAPGLYNVTASAFGFAPQTLMAVQILTDTETTVSFTLTQLPHGAIFGQVTDIQTGLPLSATLVVENTPVQVQTNPNTGAYSLSLPEGMWNIRVEADAHRIGHLTANVQANQGTQLNIQLLPAPRILLVDSGRWYYNSKAVYFKDGLDTLDYFYHLYEVRDPFGNFGPQDAPTLETLSAFDVVVWSAPLDAPGYIQVGRIITQYLETGGALLLSGQDVAFWDGGGNLLIPPFYFPDYFGAKFKAEGLLDPLTGVPGAPLDGTTLLLNTPDSDNGQYHPDEVDVKNPQIAVSTLVWPGGQVGGLVSGGCHPYRAAWTGFGLEGAGPREARIETLGAIMEWFTQPPPEYGVTGMGPNTLIGSPGEVISGVLQLANTGVQTDTYAILLEEDAWPLSLLTPDGVPLEDGGMITIPGCSNLTITATLTVPEGLPRDSQVVYTLTLTSQTQPSLFTEVPIHAKTPASILLMDDGRWQSYGETYANTLEALGLSYDLVFMQGKNLQSDQILKRYDLILWTTGLDWYSPLTPAETILFSEFLQRGGRLVLTSQDLLEHRGNSQFVREDLGVLRYTYHTTPTQVMALPDSLLGEMGLWALNYPYQNWSDHMIPAPSANPILLDEHLGVVGIAHAKNDFRTAFYSFPLETLDEEARETLIGRSLLWVSPLGESRLQLPPMAAEGTTIPITLTVGSATTRTLSSVQATFPLPAEMNILNGSINGGWVYRPSSHSLFWSGALAPYEKVTLRADVMLASPMADGTNLRLRATLDAGDQMVLTADAELWVDVPWLTVQTTVNPHAVWPGQPAAYQILLQNTGNLTATVRLTGTLPVPLTLITQTLEASSGNVLARWGRLEWSGVIPPNADVLITYREIPDFWNPFKPIVTWVQVDAPYQRLGRGIALYIAGQRYFPIMMRVP